MFTLLNTSRNTRIKLFMMIAFVFVLSLTIVLFYGDQFLLGSYAKLDNDDVKYVDSAKVLLNHHTLVYNSGTAPSAFIMPGVPLILSALMLVFGQNDSAVIAYRVLQAILQAGSIYLIFILARYVFNELVALLACAISALYLPDYYTAGMILSEAWFKAIFMLLICFTIVAIEKRLIRYYVYVAILLAAACYFKPQAVLYPIIFLIPWLIRKYSWRQMISSTLVIIITFCVLLTPWWVRNYDSFGKWIPFTSSAGSPFLEGTLIFKKLPSDGFFVQYPQYTKKNILQGSDPIMTGLQIIRYGLVHEPLKYIAWYTLIKPGMLYVSPFYWKAILGISYLAMTALHVILFILAALGMAHSLKKRNGKKQVLLLAFSYFTLIYLPFFTFDRYGYPNHFILIIFAAYQIYNLYARRQIPVETQG
jgi:4-amino-4-deoxy-L-arabinose transferase-like glycosyltransferase